MTREELREKAIEKLKSVVYDGNDSVKVVMELSSMYSFYLNDYVSPYIDLESPFIASSMIMVGKAMLKSLDKEGKKIANGIIHSGVVVAHRKAVDEK